MKRRYLVLILLCLLALAALCPAAEAEEARNIASECTYTWTKKSSRNVGDLYNGDYSYFWESAKAKDVWLEVTLPEGETCSGVQVKWAAKVPSWGVEIEQDGKWVSVWQDESDYLTTWTPLDNVTKFRIAGHSKIGRRMSINELEVYSAGERPASVQVWEPTPEKADLLMVVAHPDDEYVFLGGLIPYYGAERGKNVLVCYITESTITRRTELLDGLWTAGQRTYPLMGKFYDRYTMDMETAYKKIGKAKVRAYMVEVFRHYKPEVVVTHDINGEYGHGVHKVCADIVINALKKAADPGAYKESKKAYGTWKVKKCYIHLYGDEKEQVVFNWQDMPLEAFGGRTAYEVADAAWQCHQSQTAIGKYEVFMEGADRDSRLYGLYYTAVGKDREHNDFFENIPEREVPAEGEKGAEE